MEGPSELGISADARLASSDRTDDLASIEVPILVIGARHDTMDASSAAFHRSRCNIRVSATQLLLGRMGRCNRPSIGTGPGSNRWGCRRR